jgi:hypothetical protein
VSPVQEVERPKKALCVIESVHSNMKSIAIRVVGQAQILTGGYVVEILGQLGNSLKLIIECAEGAM